MAFSTRIPILGLFIFALLFSSSLLWAQAETYKDDYDINIYIKKIENLKNQIKNDYIPVKQLKFLYAEANQIDNHVKDCINYYQDKINSIDSIINKYITVTEPKADEIKADNNLDLFKNKKNDFLVNLSKCQLAIFDLNDVQKNLQTKIQDSTNYNLFSKDYNIYELYLNTENLLGDDIFIGEVLYNAFISVLIAFLLMFGINKFYPETENYQTTIFFILLLLIYFISLKEEFIYESVSSTKRDWYLILKIYAWSLSLGWLNFLFREKTTKLFEIIIYLIIIGLIILASLGYIYLANTIVDFITAGILFLVVIKIGNDLINGLLHSKTVNKKIFHNNHGKLAIELNITKYLLYLVNIIIAGLLFMHIVTQYELQADMMTDFIFEGFNFGGFYINIYKIIIAVFIFVLISIAVKKYSSWVEDQYYKELAEQDEKHQVPIAAVINYIGIFTAIILSLVYLGINFTNLTIIAGALSLGIGLGLQNIVNNFVSGLILLIEKPFKPGDRIIIGNVEGFIRTIYFRYTQIQTLLKEDVIVPNSDMLNSKITNLMMSDHYWRLCCTVGVAYDSDVELVREVLLNIASANKNVVNTGNNKPTVMFKNFGESNLEFQLCCVVFDVNKKFQVTSELNFAINSEFKKHKISMAAPQMDVRLIESKTKK